MGIGHHLIGFGVLVYQLVYSANEQGANFRTKFNGLYGSPGSAVNVVVTINAGIMISADSGSWPAGSNVTLIVLGEMDGPGGDGGDGGNGPNGNGSNGHHGGPALTMSYAISIDNTNGFMRGGGDGGDGGKAGSAQGGGGGGGGQGFTGGTHGNGGSGLVPGSDGTNGTYSSRGHGGAGGGGTAQRGGDGKAWGSAVAVKTNGFALTWIGGNNPLQVVGGVGA